jgi:rare lipoprotein A
VLEKTALAAVVFGGFVLMSSASSSAQSMQCGVASWYAQHSRTASGEMMNPNAMTAAHKSLPFGTKVKVINKHSGKVIYVTINDRGPFVRGRIIDLSRAAARKLGIDGVGSVCIAGL